MAVIPLLTSPFNTCVFYSATSTILTVLWCVFFTCSHIILKRRFDNWATFFSSCCCLLRHTHAVLSGLVRSIWTCTCYMWQLNDWHTSLPPQLCVMTARPTELTSVFSLLGIWRPSGASSRLRTYRHEQRIA